MFLKSLAVSRGGDIFIFFFLKKRPKKNFCINADSHSYDYER